VAVEVGGFGCCSAALWLQNKQCQGRNQHSAAHSNTKAESKPNPLASTFIIRCYRTA